MLKNENEQIFHDNSKYDEEGYLYDVSSPKIILINFLIILNSREGGMARDDAGNEKWFYVDEIASDDSETIFDDQPLKVQRDVVYKGRNWGNVTSAAVREARENGNLPGLPKGKSRTEKAEEKRKRKGKRRDDDTSGAGSDEEEDVSKGKKGSKGKRIVQKAKDSTGGTVRKLDLAKNHDTPRARHAVVGHGTLEKATHSSMQCLSHDEKYLRSRV